MLGVCRMVPSFATLGQQQRAQPQSRQVLALLALQQQHAVCWCCQTTIVLSGVIICVQVAASDVSIGQHVLVRPGEQVPLDGIITWGTANLSLQHISGEAQPVKLSPGQEVPAGGFGYRVLGAGIFD